MEGLVIVNDIREEGKILCVDCYVCDSADKQIDEFSLEQDSEYMGIDTLCEYEDELQKDIQFAYNIASDKRKITELVEKELVRSWQILKKDSTKREINIVVLVPNLLFS